MNNSLSARNDRVVSEYTLKDVERSGRGLISSTVLPGRTEGNYRNVSQDNYIADINPETPE